ncbi:MAG: Fic family protein [Planctomycetaceae bacterium]|nr:Fic family protein [Planctomycetaceae bacterium]
MQTAEFEFGGSRPEPLLCSPEQLSQREVDNGFDMVVYANELAALWHDQYFFTTQVVCTCNLIAMRGIYESAGHFRRRFVSVGRFTPPHHQQIGWMVADMCNHVNGLIADPFQAAAYLMWRLNWIHPFYDGNGRTGRQLSLLALQVGLGAGAAREIPILGYLIRKHRDTYEAVLRTTDNTGVREDPPNVTPMSDFLVDLYYEAIDFRFEDQ